MTGHSWGWVRSSACAVAGVALLCGCTVWVKPGATEAMRDAQMARCEARSYQQAPANPIVVQTDPGGYRPGEKECHKDKKGNKECRYTEGGYEEARYETQDLNRDARDAFFSACMFDNGWTRK